MPEKHDPTFSLGLKPENLEPLHDQVVIRKMNPGRTAGGLHIPETATDDAAKGEVLSTGPGRRNDYGDILPMSVKEGDVVFMPAPRCVVQLGDDMYLARESDILIRYHASLLEGGN